MIKVTRYWVPCNVLADQSGWHPDDNEVVLAGEHDVALKSAQSELAALREELAVANHEIESRISAEVGAIEALQAAEQRNAELEADKARIDFWQENPKYAGGFAPSGEWSFFSREYGTCYGKDLRSAFDRLQVMHKDLAKPTESGASE